MAQHFSVLPLDQCTLNIDGLRSVRHHLSSGHDYERYRNAFDTAAVAFLLAGCHKDDKHILTPLHFHEMFHTARQGLSTTAEKMVFREHITCLVFDALTAWDRVTGGSSLMCHVDGTQLPGARLIPEDVKALTYFSPGLQQELPETSYSIARIVQLFIEGLGLPAIRRWDDAARSLGWGLDPKGSTSKALRSAFRPLIPHSIRGSLYVFYGRCPGTLEKVIDQCQHPSQPSTTQPLPSQHQRGNATTASTASVSDDGDGDDDDDTKDLRIAQQAHEILQLHNRIDELERLNDAKDTEILRLQEQKSQPALSPRIARNSSSFKHSSHSRSTKSSAATGPMFTMHPSTPRPLSSRSSTAPSSESSVTYSTGSTVSGRVHSIPAPRSQTSDAIHSSDVASPNNTRHQGFRIFGPATHMAIRQHGLRPNVHRKLWTVEEHFPQEEWASVLRAEVPTTHEIAQELALLMVQDGDATTDA